MDIEWVEPARWVSLEFTRAAAVTELRPAITDAVIAVTEGCCSYKEISRHVREGILDAVNRLGSRRQLQNDMADPALIREMFEASYASEAPEYEISSPPLLQLQLHAMWWAAGIFTELVNIRLKVLYARHHTRDSVLLGLHRKIRVEIYRFMLRHPEMGWRLSQYTRAIYAQDRPSPAPLKMPAISGEERARL